MRVADPVRTRFEAFERAGGVYFPAYRDVPADGSRGFLWSMNPAHRDREPLDTPLAQFELGYIDHSSFAAEWPIRPDVGTAIRGFRTVLGLSQVLFAERIGVSRVSVERWESGKIRPFRGDTLELLSLLRPLTDGPLAAGQLLNVAAAVVCPNLTRPAGTYTGEQLFAMLRHRRHRHDDLGPALISMLISSEILTSVDGDNESDPENRYIPLVGIETLNRSGPDPMDDVMAVARQLSPPDRRLWLAVGERLAAKGVRG